MWNSALQVHIRVSNVNFVIWGGELLTYFLYAQMSTLYYGEGAPDIFSGIRVQNHLEYIKNRKDSYNNHNSVCIINLSSRITVLT